LGGLGKIWRGLCPPGPSLEPPLVLMQGNKECCTVTIQLPGA